MIKLIKEIMPCVKQPIYVSVSMGVDSLAAYHFLAKAGYDVIPIHFNHNLRAQNQEMQRKYRELFHMGNYCVGTNLKTESDCRQARLEYYRRVTTPINNDHVANTPKFIVTAHHLDDYVESYLMNCFRGKPEYKPISLSTNFTTFTIIHPFLLTEKKDFTKFIENWRGGWLKDWVVEDETNNITKGSRRNWIRNVIIPEMLKQEISLKKFCREQICKDIENIDCENI